MINPENYIDSYDTTQVIDQIFMDNNIPKDDNHYNRHMQEIKKKVEELRRTYKARDYFKEMPILNKDFSSYVISN
jgi:hypothetical protein